MMCVVLIVLLQFKYKASKAHDIWALGITLFHMVTGQLPWEQANSMDSQYVSFVLQDFTMYPWCELPVSMLQVRTKRLDCCAD